MQDYENELNLTELLNWIDPRDLNYSDWLNVGMGLKEAGYDASDWEEWSRRDPARFHPGECERKWNSFRGNENPVTGGTIVQMAKENGWHSGSGTIEGPGYELDWDSEIQTTRPSGAIVDHGWLERREIHEPTSWQPEQHLIRYLETLFEASESVGYVTESWEKDGKYLPTQGSWGRSAGKLIEELSKCGGDLGAVLGDYNAAAGAWIRFNPLDGQGCKNANVTDYRYALVESDTMELEQQNALIRELELPVACLVYSGGKSIHAIVRIEAADYKEYRKRVDFLYDVLKRNGLEVDTQNKNPSRLSRMPGVIRNGHKQFLMDTNIGKTSWLEWQEWIESINDNLPDPEPLTDTWDNLPELSPPLIDGVLRQGHKMLLAGPSKAGKSFALIELCIAIAEGKSWFQWPCTRGRVLYINLELDRASCLHRFRDVYNALGWEAEHLENLDIWNLRGHSVPMDKLAPKLIRRAAKKNYIAIIIDPIYKIITGDENSADQMAAFCNQFDRVCTELGAAVIYCHHHSKGSQGQKRSMDRASGSGVFARDPDALLDLIELEVTDVLRRVEDDSAEIDVLQRVFDQNIMHWHDTVEDGLQPLRDASKRLLRPEIYRETLEAVAAAQRRARARTAWRIEGTLREFPRFTPVNLWFDYPVHSVDTVGVLSDLDADGEASQRNTWKNNFGKRKSTEERKEDRKESIEEAYNACDTGDDVTLKDMANYLGVTEKTARARLKEHGGFWIDEGRVGKK